MDLAYVITVSRGHILPARVLVETLRRRSDHEIVLVGNLDPAEAREFERQGSTYIDERDVDLAGRFPAISWSEKFREVGWYRQMFLRLAIDRYLAQEYAVILDSEVFVFDNWDERRLFTDDGRFKSFSWVPSIRKSDMDYRMYQGAATVLAGLPECVDLPELATRDVFRRHISGVVLFSRSNVAHLWKRLETETDLDRTMDVVFNRDPDLSFSDHDFYGMAVDCGLFDDVVPQVSVDELAGWYDNHDDSRFQVFRDDAMWSMCQRYRDFREPVEYVDFADAAASALGRYLPRGTRETVLGLTPPPFLSFAQNREDVVLARALGDVRHGFYVDVGAGDPIAGSVTKAFSDVGWRGINVEPMREPFERLDADRPRDVNLNVALEASAGSQTYYSVAGGNELSTGNPGLAAAHRERGWDVEEVTIATRTLAEVCAEYADRDIHFLKIDVEGNEASVLAGADFTAHRPWVIVVEAVAPRGDALAYLHERMVPAPPVPTHDEWESLLLDSGYTFVLFDGLNRFYVADERAESLAPFLAAPASVLDRAVVAESERVLDAARIRSAALEERVAELEHETAAAQAELAAMRATKGWRIVQRLQALRRLLP